MSPGGGPVLGRGPGGVGQSGAAAPQNEAPGGMPEDLSWAVFRCKYYRFQVRDVKDFMSAFECYRCTSALYIIRRKSVKSVSALVFSHHPSLSHYMALIWH